MLVPGQPEPLLTPAEMADADAAAPGLGRSAFSLMAAAGAAVARAARRGGPARTLVLCGPGGNGGDGWAAARLLAQEGWPVAVASWRDPAPGTVAARMRDAWRGPVVPFAPAEAARAGLVIDALLGAGLRGEVPPEVAATLAAAAGRVLAVDVPSGLDGATGQARGTVRAAAETVCFVARKPGHLLLPGRELCGRLVLADIGMPPAALPAVRTWRNTPALWTVPALTPESHKYTRGHVTVLGGAAMTGAARLAAGGARRAGAGLVTLAAEGAGNLYRGGDPGLIVSDAPLAELLQDGRLRAWVCGPGLGTERARESLPALLAAGRLVVADADALGAHAGEPERLRGCAVLTPHEGEFAKLFGPPGPDRLAAVRAAAARVGTVVVLKGGATVIAAPDGRAAINDNAPPFLGTAGAGDVLAGMVAAHLGMGMEPWEAACAAVHLHGAAAGIAGPGMIAEDLLDAVYSLKRGSHPAAGAL